MSKKKSFALFVILVFVHFGIMAALIISRMPCGMQSNCASALADVAGEVMAFPLSIVSLGLERLGIDVDEYVRLHLGGNIELLYLLNSIVSVSLIWILLIRPVIHRRAKRRIKSPRHFGG